MYFGTTASAAPRTASRAIPATAAPTPASHSKSDSHTGAIAGGVVGGVIGLAAIICIVILVLRRRRKSTQTGAEPSRAELASNPATDPHTPKTGGAYSTQASATQSPMVEAPAYSPQGWNGEHQTNYYQGLSPQQGGYSPAQPYYPPPLDPSQAPAKHPLDMTHELPTTATPAIAELPHLHSPAPKRPGL